MAGLIDGEGSILLDRSHKNQSRYPSVSMTSTSPELIEFCQTTFGGTVVLHKKYKEHYKQSWVWTIRSNACLTFLEKLLPFMKEKKKIRRASLLITEYKSVTAANGKYSEEMLKAKKDFETRFFEEEST